MSLRFRLNALTTVMFVMILVLGTALVIHNARRAVAEEVQSTAHLALQLLEVAFGSTNPIQQGYLRARLLEQLGQFESARHLHIALMEGDRELPSGGPMVALDAKAPDWFVRLVEPEPMEYRRPLTHTSGPYTEIVVRADPTDEINEVWEEARTMLGLVLVFSVIANGLFYVAIGRWLRPVDSIVAALDGIEQGDYRARLPPVQLPELASIADKFNHMAEVLERSREENRYLAQRSLEIQEGERRYLAHELHDELGQSISAIKAVAVSIGQASGEKRSEVGAAAGTITDIASHLYAVVRGMMRRLRPVLLDEFGLVPALEELVDGWNDRQSDAFCRLTTRGRLDNLGDALNISIYRIVQECLTNVSKHAEATEVGVDLERGRAEQGDVISLSVLDNGVGFEPGTTQRGLGLLGMRERVEALDGVFRIAAAPGQGVRITIEIPVEEGGQHR